MANGSNSLVLSSADSAMFCAVSGENSNDSTWPVSWNASGHGIRNHLGTIVRVRGSHREAVRADVERQSRVAKDCGSTLRQRHVHRSEQRRIARGSDQT